MNAIANIATRVSVFAGSNSYRTSTYAMRTERKSKATRQNIYAVRKVLVTMHQKGRLPHSYAILA